MRNINELNDLPVIDSHFHEGVLENVCENIDAFPSTLKARRLTAMNVLSLTSYKLEYMAQNPLCLLLKKMYPKEMFAFGALDFALPGTVPDFAEQAKRLIQLGFDGIKMIEGKPDVRKPFNIPLDSKIYDDYYALLESQQTPIIFHNADPETFWNLETVPEWARASGWNYADGTWPQKETLYKEMEGILKKFPNLNIIFAHFYFLSADVKKAAQFLDRWPNVKLDLTPGVEMYENFAKTPEKWREFFIKYQDRILFGTDDSLATQSASLLTMVRAFLETSDEWYVKEFLMDVKGIHLDNEALEKIYYKNFQKYVAKAPKKPNIELALAECERTKTMASESQVKEINDIKKRLEK